MTMALDEEHKKALAEATKLINKRLSLQLTEADVLRQAVISLYLIAVNTSDEMLGTAMQLAMFHVYLAAESPEFQRIVRREMTDSSERIGDAIDEHNLSASRAPSPTRQ